MVHLENVLHNSSSPLVRWWKWLFSQNVAPPPPPPHIKCCFKGDSLSTLIQHCMGGGRNGEIVKNVYHDFWPGLYIHYLQYSRVTAKGAWRDRVKQARPMSCNATVDWTHQQGCHLRTLLPWRLWKHSPTNTTEMRRSQQEHGHRCVGTMAPPSDIHRPASLSPLWLSLEWFHSSSGNTAEHLPHTEPLYTAHLCLYRPAVWVQETYTG